MNESIITKDNQIISSKAQRPDGMKILKSQTSSVSDEMFNDDFLKDDFFTDYPPLQSKFGKLYICDFDL